MEPPSPSDRKIVRLLTAMVALMALWVLGLGAGAAWSMYQYTRLKSAVGGNLPSAREGIGQAVTMAAQATERQERLATALESRARATLRSTEELRRKRQELEQLDKGPLKAAQMIKLNQLMADEMLLVMTHLANTQLSMARSIRPLPAQRDLSPSSPGVGGSGREEDR